MPKLVILTRERRSENWKQSDYFIAADTVVNPEESMRKAIHEFLFTENGKKMIDYSAGDFNWGDAVMSVDKEIWNKHGIFTMDEEKNYNISGEIIEVTVNQDEILLSDEHLYLE